MTNLFAFVIAMHMAVFGGPVEAQFATTTEEGCVKLRRVIVREMKQAKLRFEVKGCGDWEPEPQGGSLPPVSAP